MNNPPQKQTLRLTSLLIAVGLMTVFIARGEEPASNSKAPKPLEQEEVLKNASIIELKELGLPNSDNFISLLVCVYSKELSPPVVLSTNKVKIERDMGVDFRNDYVEFTSSDMKRIRIDFYRLSE